VAGVCGVLLSSLAFARNQAEPAGVPVAFEVVSVRENTSASERTSFSGPSPGRFTATNFVLMFLLHEAFQIRAHQLVGAPAWIEEARYDITATYPAGAVPQRDLRPMLRQLLIDRFGLKVHRETREVPVYALVLAKDDGTLGPRLTRSNVDCEQWLAEDSARRTGPRTECMSVTRRTSMTARSQALSALLGPFQSLTGRPVVDRTGLTGVFNVDLEWTTSGDLSVTGGASAAPGPEVSLFTALQEQLGLKLEPSRAPFEVVVVDDIRRPTPD
jgi:uncharacterized protein (TIGR03435 family)